jgi:hypothetical protein
MQLGRLEMMDQAKIEHIEKINKIETLEKEHSIMPDEKYKDLEPGQNKQIKNEVILDNVQFGFDNDAKEFFVRIENNGVDYQFPTDQMMRLKTQLHEQLKAQLEEKL